MTENLNKLKVPASKYLSRVKDSSKGKDSNFIVEKQAGNNLTQVIKINITSNKTHQY